MSIEEEIRKRAEEYAKSLKIDKSYEIRLGDFYTDGKGNLVTLERIFTDAATEFYERGKRDATQETKQKDGE